MIGHNPYQSINMNPKSIRYLLTTWTLACLCSLAMAQPPRGPLVVSPQVNADKSVTFRYQAPQAKAVELSAQFEKGTRTHDQR